MEDLPDLKTIWMALWRRKWVLICVALIPIIIGAIIIKLLPASYTATATVNVEKQELNFTNYEDVLAGAKLDDQTVQTEVNLITSQALAKQTVTSTKLGDTDQFHLDVDPDASEKQKQVELSELQNKFMRSLDVAPKAGSRIVAISFTAKDPQLAQRVVNAHTQNYLRMSGKSSLDRARNLNNWMSQQVKKLEQESLAKAQAVQKYRQKAGLVLGRDSEELIYQQISDIATLLAPVETRQMELQSRAEAVSGARRRNASEATDQVIASQLIQTLKAQEAVAMQSLASIRADYGPQHPKRIAAETEVARIRSKIQQEVGLISDSTSNELGAASRQRQLLTAQLKNLQGKADSMRAKQIELVSLEQEARSSRTALENFMSRYKEIQSQVNLERPSAELVSLADMPVEPSGPKKFLLMAVVVMLSCGLALGVAFVLELMTNGFHNQEEVRDMLNRSSLGIVPQVVNPLETVRTQPESSYTESIKKVYLQGLKRRSSLHGGQGMALLVSSSLPGEGKSTFVLSLAYYLATIGKRVLVLDTDPRRPSIHDRTGIELSPGFTELARGKTNLSNIIKRDQFDMFDVIPAGERVTLAPDVLNSDRARDLLNHLKERYDFIIFDTPPILALADAGILSELVDEVVMIAEWTKTPKKKVAYSIKAIEDFSKPILGVVLSKVNLAKYALYDYGDAGIYYGANAKYYSNG